MPVKAISSKQIILNNSSDQSIYFKITNAEGYVFKPNEGIIMKNKPVIIEVLIESISASAIVAKAQITLDKKLS